MKRLINIAFILLLSVNVFAQISPSSEYSVRKMETIGYASTNIVPNIVYTSFVIKEYTDNGKKVSIKETEATIRKVIKKLGCKTEDLSIGNIYGYISYNGPNNEEGNFEHRRLYLLKLSSVDCVDLFLDNVDSRALESFNIDEMDNEDIDDELNKLQNQSFAKAKEKATTLLATYGEECGKVLDIQEINRFVTYPTVTGKGNRSQVVNVSGSTNYDNSLKRTNTIKVEYMVKITFEIK